MSNRRLEITVDIEKGRTPWALFSVTTDSGVAFAVTITAKTSDGIDDGLEGLRALIDAIAGPDASDRAAKAMADAMEDASRR